MTSASTDEGIRRVLASIAEELTHVLTLLEGLSLAEFQRSRFVRAALEQHFFAAAQSLARADLGLPEKWPELDWEMWRRAFDMAQGASEYDSEGVWLAMHALSASSLSWLRIHADARPNFPAREVKRETRA